MELKHETAAIDISSVMTLPDVISGVADKKIVYVGEVHDVTAHHAVQLEIISGIYKRDRKIAIGMEMFQRPFQGILDSFIAGRMDEQDFLEKSGYVKRWGIDYQLYKPILDFARSEKIPVLALNLRQEIIKKVSKNGIDSLSDEEKKEIPSDLDFSNDEYREWLKKIFSMHKNADKKNFDYFCQSQILWDETMSQSIAEFLQKSADYQIIVLAGQGHLRFGSGIPKRTFRRTGHDYAIVLIDDKVEKGIADYVIFPKPVSRGNS